MKMIFLMMLTLGTSFATAAERQCAPEAIDQGFSADEIIQACQMEGQKQGRSRLTVWISEKAANCSSYYSTEKSFAQGEYKKCFQDMIAGARNILTCTQSEERHKQAVEYDIELEAFMLQDHGEVAVPENIRRVFNKLVDTTMKHVKFAHAPQWTLRAYKGKVVNAHAGAGGNIFLSNVLWTQKNPYSEAEIAAILGHEIGHVILAHSLKLDCLYLEWIGMDMSLKEAAQAFREDYSPGTERGKASTTLSQKYEYEADQMSKSILQRSGYDPRLMAQALEKMKPKDTEGFSSGSHPAFDERIRALD